MQHPTFSGVAEVRGPRGSFAAWTQEANRGTHEVLRAGSQRLRSQGSRESHEHELQNCKAVALGAYNYEKPGTGAAFKPCPYRASMPSRFLLEKDRICLTARLLASWLIGASQ